MEIDSSEALNLTPLWNSPLDHESSDSGPEAVSSGLLAMGTALVVMASFISCLGVNFQKLSHNKNEMVEKADRTPMYKSPYWVGGICLMILGSIMDMVALPFVPLTRVSALGASGIVANLIITPIFLKEKLTTHDLIGGTITVVGTTIACIFGAQEEKKITSDDLLRNFHQSAFILYYIIQAVFLLLLLYLCIGFNKVQKAANKAGLIEGSLECVWAWQNIDKIVELEFDHRYIFVTRFGPQFYPVCHAVYAGIFGAQSVMYAKAVLTFLSNAAENRDTWVSVGMMFLFILPTVFCLWNQIHFLNLSLQIYRDALFILPVYQALWIGMGIVSGLIFYQEYKDIDDYHMGLFALGVIISICGLGVLAFRKSKTPQIESPLMRRSMQNSHPHHFNTSGSRLSCSFSKPAALTGSFNFAEGYDDPVNESLPLLSSPPTFPRAHRESPKKESEKNQSARNSIKQTSPLSRDNSGSSGSSDSDSDQSDEPPTLPEVKISIN
eukprot:TRINITY_DN188_c5_g1_i1.p1 TRINITY_DN188_c5_g1~~TRINITY_DN188_c5_g1_i1.p1  ORF type:complete len:523 (+),score=78.09 TRINITY_DN188_c5_g1_i1:83-1570(+)